MGVTPASTEDAAVIAATIHFTLGADTDWEAVRSLLGERAQLYVGVPGLVSKAFVYDPATSTYGGNYVWESRRALDDFLGSDIFAGARARFGEPRIGVYEVAAYLDRGEVVLPARAG